MLAVAAWCAVPWGAMAADIPAFPTKPVRIVVGFGPGTATDTVARLIGDRLAPALGQPVVIENRAGASGNIANELVARAAPDGHSLVVGAFTSTVLPSMPGRAAVHPLHDLTPVIKLVSTTIVIAAGPSAPYKSLADLVAAARRAPGSISYSTSGVATPPHLAAAMLSSRAGIDMVHVPYGRGSVGAQQDILAGIIPVSFMLWSAADALIHAGQLRPLAVTSAERFFAAPGVPTVAELGYPGFEISSWLGIFAPAGTAPEIVSRLNAELARVLAQPEVRERLGSLGWQIVGNSPAEFASDVRAELKRWPAIVRDLKLE
jgi:tripartite-type tricarboxylate transporter receptor subunit TctC